MRESRLSSDSLSIRDTNPLAFFAGFLRNPQEVGSLIPSSRFLEQKIIQAALLDEARLVVELGPGTGGTTRAILARLPADATLLTIDMSREFIDLLDVNITDPRLINHHGSAADLPAILQHYGLGAPDAIISGIPFSTMPAATGRSILQSIAGLLAPGGRFVAYQFRNDVAVLAEPILGKPCTVGEWRNVPPMRVYRWIRRAVDTPGEQLQSTA
ncbi:MAG: methyltransferase domain-containing protein [Spongiibacteraceae bacterium]|jgi:phospholipid N-methyltransferase|nr:methyltransferase domain-containing protein [Spongiibacteraceae bacterium]